MHLEIERKYLVKDGFKNEIVSSVRIWQGYLDEGSGNTVRVRIAGRSAYLTIKGKSNSSRTTRFEWEKRITRREAKELMALCAGRIVEKTRYYVPSGRHIFEVDMFHGDNSGLIVAEIELSSEDEEFIKPQWLGEEVTEDKRYTNSMLSRRPYNTW